MFCLSSTLLCLSLFLPGPYQPSHMKLLSMELQSDTPMLTFISCTMCVSHAIPYAINMTDAPPSLSCFSLCILALETSNQECLPSFSCLFPFFVTRWHLSALKSGGEEGKKTHIFDVVLPNFKGFCLTLKWLVGWLLVKLRRLDDGRMDRGQRSRNSNTLLSSHMHQLKGMYGPEDVCTCVESSNRGFVCVCVCQGCTYWRGLGVTNEPPGATTGLSAGNIMCWAYERGKRSRGFNYTHLCTRVY